MARLKRILKSALEDRSPRFMLATIALAVAISLIAGFAIGYKVEEHRKKPAKKVATHKTTSTTKPKPVKIKAAPLLVGGVFAVQGKQLVIVTAKRKSVRVSIGPKTRIALAEPAKASNIVVGSRVLFQPVTGKATTAIEVVVLPPKALVGTPVTAVVPGTSMTLKSLKGSGTVVTTTGAKVVTTSPSNRKHIVKRTRVIVQYYIAGSRHPAVQIVVLPANSTFR
jgi:hypothetical protein